MSFIEDLKEFNSKVAEISGVSVQVWHDHTKELHVPEKQRKDVNPVSSYFFKPIESGYDFAHRTLTIITDPLVFLCDFVQSFLYGLYLLFKKAVELHTGVVDPLEPLPEFSDYTSYLIQSALGVVVSLFANLIDLIVSTYEAYKISKNMSGEAAAPEADAEAPAMPVHA